MIPHAKKNILIFPLKTVSIFVPKYVLPKSFTTFFLLLLISFVKVFCSRCEKTPLNSFLLGLSGHVLDFFSLEVSAAFASVASCCLIDSALYGWSPTVVPWNFFRQNVLRDVASFYGTHTWHW